MDELQPGQVISPRSSDEPQQPNGAPEPERPVEPTPEPVPAPTPPAEPVAETAQAQPAPTQPEAETSNWAYRGEPDTTAASSAVDMPEQLTWTAAEFVAHEKSVQWYAGLMLAGLAAAAADYFITHDLFSTIVIVLAAAAFAAFAARKPREQQYGIDPQGVWVGNKVYNFHDFKTFSIVEEAGAASIMFMPLKRFMPPLTIYLSPEIEDTVLNFLSSFLPFEQHKPDAVDSLLRRIRF